MTDTGFTSIDLTGLEELISDENIDLETLNYTEDEQTVSFDVLRTNWDNSKIEKGGKRDLTVYPIVRQAVLFHNVTHLKKRSGRREVALHGVTLDCRREGTITINGGGGKLVMDVSGVQIEVGPETDTEWEYVTKVLRWGIKHGKWRTKTNKSEAGRGE